VTDEGKSSTEPWIEKHKVQYAYGYDKNSGLKKSLKVSGIPAAWLVDPSGTIVWEGHPASLTEDIIAKALEGALTQPMWEWPAAFAQVSKALKKSQLAAALEAAQKVAETEQDGPKILAAVQGMIAGRAKSVRAPFDAGDYLTAYDVGQVAKKDLKGLPEEADVSEVLEKISKDKEMSAVMKAQKSVRKLGDEQVRSAKDAEKLIEQLTRIAKKSPGTAAEREAEEIVARLQAMRDRLQNR